MLNLLPRTRIESSASGISLDQLCGTVYHLTCTVLQNDTAASKRRLKTVIFDRAF